MGPSERYDLSRRDGELIRVAASVLVVVSHCVHFWVEQFYGIHSIPSLGFLATIIDQFTRFTVPAFFFLSGFGLTVQFLKEPPKLRSYYRFRIPKVLAPFLLWSGFSLIRHLDFLGDLPWHTAPLTSAGIFARMLFLDGFDYQYYFLIIIFQFYLIFPFVYRLAKSRASLVTVFIVHMIFMSPIEAFLEPWGLEIPKLHSNLLLYYGFYCFVGMHAAWHRDFLSGLLRRWSGFQALGFYLLALALIIGEYYLNIEQGKALDESDHFNRWSVLIYCLACLLLFMKCKPGLERIHKHTHLSFLYTGVAPFTFFVYLAHTHILRAVDFLCWEVTLGDFLRRIVFVVMGTYGLAWMAQWLLEDYPKIRFALGLPKARLNPGDLPGFTYFAALRLKIQLKPAEPAELQSLQSKH